jgi:hypothetical protein
MQTGKNRVLVLDASALATDTDQRANEIFEARHEDHNSQMRDDGEIPGIGDGAYSLSATTFRDRRVLIEAHSENLLVTVVLTIQLDEPTSIPALRSHTSSIVKELIDAVPRH